MKFFSTFFMVAIGFSISLFGQIHNDKIIFAFLSSPRVERFDSQIWNQVAKIVDNYSTQRNKSSCFTLDLLNAGLKAADELFEAVHKNNINIDSWTLINIDPEEFSKSLNGRVYRYLKFELFKKDLLKFNGKNYYIKQSS